MQELTQRDFADEVLARWRECLKSLGHSEIDERQAFSTQVLEKLLGYDHTKDEYHVEERGTRTDIAVYDKQHNRVLVVETKRSDISIDDSETLDYAMRYADPFTRYVALSNLKKFKLFKIDKTLLADIPFETILTRAKTVDGLRKEILASEYGAIDRIRFISKEELWDDAIFNNFQEGYHATDVANPSGFSSLITTLEKCVSYLFGYAIRAYLEYAGRLKYFDESLAALEHDLKSAQTTKDTSLESKITAEIYELRRSNQIYLDFRNGLNTWRTTSQRTYKTESEYSEAFCREAAYVLLNKVLFIRVCEDKRLLTKKISNGGIAVWNAFTEYLRDNHKDLLILAYSDASHLYQHIYQSGIFDWYQSGNSELNDILKRIFWNLNHFDFAHVDRDILGHLYEQYLSPDQRKALGEFYTPPEIVRYILDEVGYVSTNEQIRGARLIDIGCGSGGFLVEAINRLMQACESASIPKTETLQIANQAIYGFDIDHFAIHICEMNLAFRLVDAYKEAKTLNKQFLLPRLRVYQTNSLTLPESVKQARLYSSENLYLFLKEREEVEKLKSTPYNFLVGNPPYVTKQLTQAERDYYKKVYAASIENRFNTYRLFIHRAWMMLQEGGLLGYIVPNTWIADIYATAFRRFLRENFRIIIVVPLPEKAKAFYKVTQSTTILILQKDSGEKGNYSFKLAKQQIEDITKLPSVTFCTRQIQDVSFGEDDSYKLVLSPDDLAYSFITKMRTGVDFLGSIVEDIQSGEVRQVEVKANLHLGEYIEGSFPVIHGDNTDAYFVDLTLKRKDAMWYTPPDNDSQKLFRDDHSTRQRIVLQRIANIALRKRIKAAMLKGSGESPIYVENGANYILCKRSRDYPIPYILGLLNSSALNQYFRLFSSSNNVQPSELKRLPIKKPTRENQSLVKEIADKATKVTEMKNEYKTAKDVQQTPQILLSKIPGVPIFKSDIRKFPSRLEGPIQLRREEMRVYVTVTDHFECASAIQARCVEILLSHIKDLSEVSELLIPKSEVVLKEFVKAYDDSCRIIDSYPTEIEKLDRAIDETVYKLYGLSSDEVDLVEHKTLGFTEAVEDSES